MRAQFFILARNIMSQLEAALSKGDLKDDYVYRKIPQLIEEVENLKFSGPKTDIGLAAIKLLDLGVYQDQKLKDDIVHLDELYRLIQKPGARI